MKRSLILTLLLGIAFGHQIQAQPIQFLNYQYNLLFEDQLYAIDTNNFHTAVKPWNSTKIGEIQDRAIGNLHLETDKKWKDWASNRSLLEVEKAGEYKLIFNPTFALEYGVADTAGAVNFVRGANIRGSIGKKIHFFTDLSQMSAVYPDYVLRDIQEQGVIPGYGRERYYEEYVAQYTARGFVLVNLNKYINAEFGQGRHFIGEGYRSLLLSDNAFQYPYLKLTTSFWKVQYVNLFTQMLDVNKNQNLFPRKYITSHFLSVNLTDRLNVGLFESVIYEDSSGVRGYDLNYLNPIILYRPIEFVLGSRGGNVLMGLNVKYKLTNHQHLYGQFVLDEFKASELFGGRGWWANKYGVQLGVKSYHTFIPNLTAQTEFNWVRPYTYSHRYPLQNYAHYRDPLAHPLGANFVESVSILHYQNKRWYGTAKVVYFVQGRDTLGSNWGSDVFISYDDREQDFGNAVGQGVRTQTLVADLQLGYIISPVSNFRAMVGFRHRRATPQADPTGNLTDVTNYFYFGINTSFENIYLDF